MAYKLLQVSKTSEMRSQNYKVVLLFFSSSLEVSNVFLKLVYNFYCGFQMGICNLKPSITSDSVAIRSDTLIDTVITFIYLFSLNIKTGVRDNETVDNSICSFRATFNEL